MRLRTANLRRKKANRKALRFPKYGIFSRPRHPAIQIKTAMTYDDLLCLSSLTRATWTNMKEQEDKVIALAKEYATISKRNKAGLYLELTAEKLLR